MDRHPLGGVRLKLERAEKQFNWLKDEVLDFLDPDPHSLVGKFEPEDGSEFVIRVHASKSPPPWWSVVIGEILHDLRSTLDHLAWQLGCLGGSEPHDRTEFPIFINEDGFENTGRGGGRWKIQDLPETAQAEIQRLQPYTADNPERDLLWALHELNRIDKHRLLPLVGYSAQSVSIKVFANGQFRQGIMVFLPGRLDEGTEVHRLPFSESPRPKVEVEGQVESGIAFREPSVVEGWPAIYTLHEIGGYIVTGVLPKFEPLLGP